MNLQEIIKAVDRLSPEERAELLQYLNKQKPEPLPLRAGTMNVDKVVSAARAIRADMVPEDFDEMLNAMNEEYVEPVDEDGWPQ